MLSQAIVPKGNVHKCRLLLEWGVTQYHKNEALLKASERREVDMVDIVKCSVFPKGI
jgi:hypothetical protein